MENRHAVGELPHPRKSSEVAALKYSSRSSRLRRPFLRATLAVLLATAPTLASPVAEALTKDNTSRQIVVLKESGTNPFVASSRVAQDSKATIHHTFSESFNGYSATLTKSALEKIKTDPSVESIFEDSPIYAAALPRQIVPAIPNFVQWVRATRTLKPDKRVITAVIDSGVDTTHPALAGYIHDFQVNCFQSGVPQTDKFGHGTRVTGITIQVQPVMIVPIKVLGDRGEGNLSNLICGQDVTAGNVRGLGITSYIISLGTTMPTDQDCKDLNIHPLRRSHCYLMSTGAPGGYAAGNHGEHVRTFAPAGYPESISVSAVDALSGNRLADSYAIWSNYGATVAAPGRNLRTFAPGGGTDSVIGTSYANPIVVGLINRYQLMRMQETKPDQPFHRVTREEARAYLLRYAERINDPTGRFTEPAVSEQYFRHTLSVVRHGGQP
jgi:hypothetical protein